MAFVLASISYLGPISSSVIFYQVRIPHSDFRRTRIAQVGLIVDDGTLRCKMVTSTTGSTVPACIYDWRILRQLRVSITNVRHLLPKLSTTVTSVRPLKPLLFFFLFCDYFWQPRRFFSIPHYSGPFLFSSQGFWPLYFAIFPVAVVPPCKSLRDLPCIAKLTKVTLLLLVQNVFIYERIDPGMPSMENLFSVASL